MPEADTGSDSTRTLIDAGVFIGALLAGDPRHAEARGLVERARRGELHACTTTGILRNHCPEPGRRLEDPGSVEAYYQEAGRAGRDDEPAECLVLFNQADVRTREFFIGLANPRPQEVRALPDWPMEQPDDLLEVEFDQLYSLRYGTTRPRAGPRPDSSSASTRPPPSARRSTAPSPPGATRRAGGG